MSCRGLFFDVANCREERVSDGALFVKSAAKTFAAWVPAKLTSFCGQKIFDFLSAQSTHTDKESLLSFR